MDPMDKERDVDQWLESALGQYGKAEPRPGLENRVLANLHGERNRMAAQRRWWRAAGAAAALAVIVAAVWLGESRRERNPEKREGASTTTPREEARGSIQPEAAPQVAHTAKAVAQRRRAKRPTHDLVIAIAPKLEQFPSARKLSEEELALIRYLQENPNGKTLLEATAARPEADLSISSLETGPLETPEIGTSVNKTNGRK